MSADPRTPSMLADTFIYQTLAADSQIAAFVGTRIFTGQAPEGTPYPLITIQDMGSVPTNPLGIIRSLTRVQRKVAAADLTGSFAQLDPILDRIDTLLFGNGATYPHGSVVTCTMVREQQIFAPERGREYRELARFYEVITNDRP